MDTITFVVVDDASLMRALLIKVIVENANYKVVGEGSNGLEAIDQAKKNKPSIMMLDITMPVMDGLQAVKEILKVSPETKIIMISAQGQQPLVIRAIKDGAKDFVIKPFDKTRVIMAIRNVLSN